MPSCNYCLENFEYDISKSKIPKKFCCYKHRDKFYSLMNRKPVNLSIDELEHKELITTFINR